MAKIKKSNKPVKAVAPVKASKKNDAAEAPSNEAVIMVKISKKLRGRLKIAAMASGESVTVVLRTLIKEWVLSQANNIGKYLKAELESGDDEDEDTDEDADEDTEEEEDEDEEEEEDED